MAEIQVDDQLIDALSGPPHLFLKDGAVDANALVSYILEREMSRRGGRDPATGALTSWCLRAGELLRPRAAWPWRGLAGEWRLGAMVVDVRNLKLINDRFGLPVGHALIAGVARALMSAFPEAQTIRIHGDAFAVLLFPPEDGKVSPSTRSTLRDQLVSTASSCLEGAGEAPTVVDFTMSLLSLVVENPYEWQLLGPLVAAELNRAHDLERTGKAAGVQERRLDLQGHIPEDP